MKKYTGYKIKFEDETETKGYATERFCKFFLRHIQYYRNIKGEIVECGLNFFGDAIQKESAYQLLKLEEICIRCRNQKPYIAYEEELFIFRNPNGHWIAWGKDRSQVEKDSWGNCKYCQYHHKIQEASNAYVIGYAKEMGYVK